MFGTFTRFYLRKRLSRKRNWKQRADALIREGRPDEAETRLKKPLRYQQDNPVALSRTALISERRKDWEAAVARWERVIETSSGQTQAAYGKPVETGKYEKPKGEGHGVTREQIETAKHVGLQIPAPYMRIDFLKGHDGICFTEFCFAPGGFGQFDAESDLRPGGLYLRAEIRLQNDLPGGKAFDHFARLDNG